MHTEPESRHVDRDELLARVDLAALLDELVAPADQRRRWHCPDRDHPDEHPSVTIRVGAGGVERWRCWSGGHGGTAIDAVVAARRVDVGEAIRWLAHHSNTNPTVRPRPAPPIAAVGEPDPAVGRFVEHASKLLWTAAGRQQRDWLLDRGLRPEVLRANRVGADPGRRLLPRPAGLPGGWPAVIYPALSVDGDIAYLQARYLNPPEHRSKYDNPSAHLAANPRLAWTRPIGPSRNSELLLVCEGIADALIAAQAGITAVGVLGAAAPDRRVADRIAAAVRWARHGRSPNVVVCFDGDEAGRSGASRLVAGLTERDTEATLLTPPDGLDLTSWALAEPDWHRQLPGTNRLAEVTAPLAGRVASDVLSVGSHGRSISISGLR